MGRHPRAGDACAGTGTTSGAAARSWSPTSTPSSRPSWKACRREPCRWRDPGLEGRQAPAFAELQRRIGRKTVGKKLLTDVPVAFMVYDLLELSGRDVRQEPLTWRRKGLKDLVSEADLPMLVLSEVLPHHLAGGRGPAGSMPAPTASKA